MIGQNIAGLSMKGGRKDNFYFCLIEYYSDSERWFLKSLLAVKEEDTDDSDDAVRSWIDTFKLKKLIVDFPLSQPACQSCLLHCPGIKQCPEPSVVQVRKYVDKLIEDDQGRVNENPKKYEQERNKDDEIVFNKNVFAKPTSHHILSRSFRRRLKKGYAPYWNRPLDFWIWANYYDQLLDTFNLSFDSFGNTSLMILSRFSYLKKHLPQEMNLLEGNQNIVLLELLRSGIILKKDLANLNDIDLGIEGRLDIIRKIEHKLGIFIYDHDLEILVKKPRAFDSFLLALAGQNVLMKKNLNLPEWTKPEDSRFIVPNFSP